MIRPFNLRDLPLMRRLSERGVSLHTESALTNNLNPLREALFSLVGGDYSTYVWKFDKGPAAGFIQLMLDEGEQHARIIYISPNDEAVQAGENDDEQISSNDDVWLPLLDQAVVETGSRGIHSLVAEVNETGPELPLLRRAGFAVYTRQDVWRLDETAVPAESRLELTPRRPVDDWDIQLLYGNMVPRLVQLVEPAPPLNRGGWLLRENGELAAFSHLRFGSIGTWLRLFIHPNAEAHAGEIVTTMARIATSKAIQPIYCCVRRYQSWLERPLQDAGFIYWGSQAVMVKHTVHHMPRPLPELSAVIDSQHIPASAPMIPHYDRSRVNGKQKLN